MKNRRISVILILLGLIVFTLVIVFLGIYAMSKITTFYSGLCFIICFIAYFILLFIVDYLSEKFPTVKVFELIYKVIFMPVFLVLKVSFPILTILLYLLCFSMFVCIIPILLICINTLFSIVPISMETSIFIFFTSSAIIATSFFKTFIKITDKYSALRLNSSEKIKTGKIKELIHYIFTLNNIRFCIYVIYFFFVIIFSFKNVENTNWLELINLDNAIMQSFIAYLAYDNIINNIKRISFSPIDFFEKIVYSIKTKDDDDKLTKK